MVTPQIRPRDVVRGLVPASGRVSTEDEPTEILDEHTAEAAATYAASRLSVLPPPRELRPGVILRDRYALGDAIARGGQSTIFRAQDLRRDEAAGDASWIAVKVLRDEYAHEANIARLRREFRQSQAVQHPQVVHMYDLDCDLGTWFITMELLDGMSLRARINRAATAPIHFAEAVSIAGGCAAVLGCAHRKGIPHGDIKPSNVFLPQDGGIKVLDFGAAREIHPASTDGELDAEVVPAAATRVYASPEVLEGLPAEPRDDVFSLACVVYEMLTRRHPFDRIPASEAREQRLEANPLPGLSPAQNAVLARGLAWSRAERPTDIEDWVRSLAQAQTAVTAAEEFAAPPVVATTSVAASLVIAPAEATAMPAEASIPTPLAALVEPPAPVPAVPLVTPTTPPVSTEHGRTGRLAAAAALVLLLAAAGYLLVRDRDGTAPPDVVGPGDTGLATTDPSGPATAAVPPTSSPAPEGDGHATAPSEPDPTPQIIGARDEAVTAAHPATQPPATGRPPAPSRARIAVATTSIRIAESAPAAVVVLRRVGGAEGIADVPWQTQDGSAEAGADYRPSAGMARFLDRQVTRAIYVPLVNDEVAEAEQHFSLTLTESGSAELEGPRQVDVAVLDDDG